MINQAFEALLRLKSRPMNIERIGELGPIEIQVAPSNYFRNMAGPEEMSIEGHEFVIGLYTLNGFGKIKRGDVLSDPDYGDLRVKEVRPLSGFGGDILGYRVRCG